MSEPSPVTYTNADAGSRSAGELLRDARERQGLSLDQLAQAIKVSVTKLGALEAGQFDQLPDANFTRALAMAVCRSLKVDAAPVLAGLPAARTMPLHTEKPPLNQPFRDSRRASPLFDQPFALRSVLSLKWLAPLLLLLASVVVYVLPESLEWPTWLHLKSSTAAEPAASEAVLAVPLPVAPQAVTQAASSALVAPDAAVSASAPSLVASAAASAVPLRLDTSRDVGPGVGATAAPPASSVVPVDVGPGHELVFTLTASSWIDVRDGAGVKLISRQADIGEVLRLQGRAPLKVRIGNAAGVQLSYSGRAIDLLPFTRANVATLELK